MPVLAWGPPPPSSDAEADVEVSDIDIDVDGELYVGTVVTASGTITITATSEANFWLAWDNAQAESSAGFTVTDPNSIVVDSDLNTEEDSDTGWFGAEADASQVYNWSSTFELDTIGDYLIEASGSAFASWWSWWHSGSDEDEGYSSLLLTAIPEPQERNPNRFSIVMCSGFTANGRYIDEHNNTLRGEVVATGEYNGEQYMLVIPEGCIITRLSGERLHQLFLKDIDGSDLTFTCGDVTFSEPCVLSKVEGGELTEDPVTGEWTGDGEWVEVGSFTEIVDGEVTLD